MHVAFVRPVLAVSTLCVGLTIFSAVPASSQQDDRDHRAEAILYREQGFTGPATTVRGERPNLGLGWNINSVTVGSGRWQLCAQPNYQGRCVIVERDTRVLGSIIGGVPIQSARPLSGGATLSTNQTVQGNFAQFHTQPQAYGQRINACPTGNPVAGCAARTADQFCRNSGWGGSAREHLETVGNVVYLADVLCVRNNF